ncbi:quinate 5-dehydrogenase [Effusibacillus consociatus]|uniref:Quinate 5-dehydrogenase n=1 Tax=Effusibacillus consociatus TaxID=1117041 RepID=A0ABV9Q1P5_9BACL
MKRVVSVSLGSSNRNHRVRTVFCGEEVEIERIGTDGDRKRLIQLIRELDGSVDAFGMGGIDRYIYVNQNRFTFREAEVIARAAVRTPILDGSGLKNTLERMVVEKLAGHPHVQLRGKKVLLVSGLDRFGMAEALVQNGCEVVFGDLMFGLGLPVPIRSLAALERTAKILAPLVTKLPIRFLYPTGYKQEAVAGKFASFYADADVIAGDFHFIRRHLPEDLWGKIILTNTVTALDKSLLKERGVRLLITTTPHLEGRSFGTNVMEALLVALAGQKDGDLTESDYRKLIEEVGLEPYIEWL